MKRPGRLRTVLLTILVLLLLIAAGAFLAMRYYLHSGRVAPEVASRLQSVLGGRVQVGAADVGLTGGSSLRGVEVFEDNASQNGQPWIKIGDVQADLSVLDLVRGDTMPHEVQVHDAQIALRFDRDGHLLTKLPSSKGASGQVPRVVIDNGQVTLNQEGHRPMVVGGVKAELTGSGQTLDLRGTVDDPFWGQWTVQGGVDSARDTMSLTLDTPEVVVTQEKLDALAFVPARVWQEVQFPHGNAPVQLKMSFQTSQPGAHYRVALTPRDTTLHVESIGLTANQASGKVVVEDELVQLRDVHGRTAQGGIVVQDADLDFRSSTTRLDFKQIQVDKVVLSSLPKKWELPKQIDGQLTGNARLLVTIATGGHVHTEGNGAGVVDPATVLGFKADPIRLVLHADGKRFHFSQDQKTALRRMKEEGGRMNQTASPSSFIPALPLVLVLAAPPSPAPSAPETDSSLLSLLQLPPRAVGRLTQAVVDATSAGLRQVRRWQEPLPPGKQPNYLEANLGLQDVDLALLVQRLKLRMPFPLAGRLSFNVRIGIPIDTPKDTRAYRLNGTATMARLNLAGVNMVNVRARVRYLNGILHLEGLQGEMPQPSRAGAAPASTVTTPGTFAGNATYEVAPEGDLSGDLKVDHIPLDQLLVLLPGLKQAGPQGTLSGTVSGRASARQLSDPASWRGRASLRSERLEAYGVTAQDVSANLAVRDAQATLRDFRATLEGGPLTGSADVGLSGDYPYKAKLDLSRVDLGAIQRLAPSFRPPFPVQGRATLSADLAGKFAARPPLPASASGAGSATDLVVNGVKFDALRFDWSEDARGLRLSGVQAKLYQGEVTGSALIPLANNAAGAADLRIKDVDVGGLTGDLPGFPVRLGGRVSGTIKGKATEAAAGRSRSMMGDVEVAAPDLTIQGIPATRVQGSIEYRNGAATYRLVGDTLGGKFRLNGKLPARPAAAGP